jgi:hypothetical protein
MMEIAKKYKIPVTKRLEEVPKDPKELINKIYNEKDKIEGYVISFDDGDMYKVKTNIYSCSHSISTNSDNLNERVLLKSVCLNVIDDVISNINFSKKDQYVIQNWRDETCKFF